MIRTHVPVHDHTGPYQGGKLHPASIGGVGAITDSTGTGTGTTSVAAVLTDLGDVTITSPAEDDTLRYVGGEWVNDNRRWEPVTSNPGGGPEIVFSGDDIVMTWATY